MAEELKSSNPALSKKIWENAANQMTDATQATMTVSGTVHRTGILTLIVFALAMVSWNWATAASALAMPAFFGGLIGALVVALIICFAPGTAPILAPVYAALEGLSLGVLSALFEAHYPGIAVQALGGTLATLVGMLMAYQFGLIRATPLFKKMVIAATLGIALLFVVNLVMMLFGSGMSFLGVNGSWLAIGVSAAIVLVAAFNLILDFDFIEKGAEAGAPKKMEWYGAFGLMVTLIWLYISILRLLANLRER